MAELESQTICKYYNSGFCKFKSDCKSYHSQINCTKYSCKDKTCTNRHPKKCRYKDQCRRRSTCLYSHEERSDCETISLVKENDFLKSEIALLKEKIEKTMKHMESMDDQLTRLKKSIKANNVKYASNNEVIQAYIERTGKLCEQEINVEKRLVSNEKYILRLENETKEKVKSIQNSINNIQKGGCTFCGKVFNEENQLKMHHTDNPNHCENCYVCYQTTLSDTSLHSSHKYFSKFK